MVKREEKKKRSTPQLKREGSQFDSEDSVCCWLATKQINCITKVWKNVANSFLVTGKRITGKEHQGEGCSPMSCIYTASLIRSYFLFNSTLSYKRQWINPVLLLNTIRFSGNFLTLSN